MTRRVAIAGIQGEDTAIESIFILHAIVKDTCEQTSR
ncbi:hypothetical protein TKV_c11490 [Thermoanaerobacter kivui]|uniref:Uncharacterized protein n=1 Tax=Thermoanaerobacter kivui TaxID=2325 RepID=A0A097AR69_THEKI|nr:hypothetical protein TKV_c11490 [Thermoanaerobacter kivui]